MAFNPSPAVAEARDIGIKHDDDMVIVLRIKLNDRMQYASYGRTKSLCDLAHHLAEALYAEAYEVLAKVEKKLASRP